ncbi:MAG: carboxymethylenebutenolidase [Rhodospirillales bacterium]|nr:carboxymethylenebutenolidase [Rhodospirillales bacterium]
MGYDLSLTTSDGHILNAYSALPDGETKGGMVIIQEIFGVNDDIRETVDNFAREGYHAIAPAMFDRIESGVILGFDETGMNKGRELKGGLDWSDVVQDVNAAISHVKKAGKVGIVGFCMGGSVAWFAASRSPVDVAICYYGGDINANRMNETPKCPVMFHWGEEDGGIPLEGVKEVEAAHPNMPSYVYEGAGHGFSCSRRGSYHPASASKAMQRTLAFAAEHLS